MNLAELTNKLYDFSLRTYLYVTSVSTGTGLGNGFSEIGKDEFYELFGRGFWNNVELSIIVMPFYSVVFNKLRETKHYRLYANLCQTGVSACFLLHHYYAGTDNPLQAVTSNMLILYPLVNKHVSETMKD